MKNAVVAQFIAQLNSNLCPAFVYNFENMTASNNIAGYIVSTYLSTFE
jgi:hypothetical protein